MSQAGSLLVVDDNQNNRDALSRRLKLQGYDVTTAASGYEALALAAGGDDFDTKPVRFPQLLEKIERLLGKGAAK